MKRFAAASLLLLALTAGRAASADAPTTDDARAYFNRGVEFYRDGTFEAALVQFKRAYETVPNYRVLYNIAQTALRLQDFATALTAYERYLRDGGAEIPADRRSAVEQELTRLQARVSRVTVTTNAAAGEIYVDDALAATLPLSEPLVLSAGRRKLTLVPRGGAPITRVVEVPGGDKLTVPLDLPSPVAAAAAPPAKPPQAPPSTSSSPPSVPEARSSSGTSIAPFVAGGVALVATGGAVFFGVRALDAKSDADAALARFPGSREELDDARQRTKTMALATDVLAATAVVAAGVSIVLFATSSRPAAGTPAASAALAPNGVRLHARF